MKDADYQNETLELLLEVDEHGRGLTRDEINFVADLIDGDVRCFNLGQASRIRALHRRCVEAFEDMDDDELELDEEMDE